MCSRYRCCTQQQHTPLGQGHILKFGKRVEDAGRERGQGIVRELQEPVHTRSTWSVHASMPSYIHTQHLQDTFPCPFPFAHMHMHTKQVVGFVTETLRNCLEPVPTWFQADPLGKSSMPYL